MTGTSPRTWGNLFKRDPHIRRARYIPTHVGKSSEMLTVAEGLTVHPHARGEIYREAFAHTLMGGTSPRTWGNLSPGRIASVVQRYIPTHVGKSGSPSLLSVMCSVHPHARGEIRFGGDSFNGRFGTSPRTWGNHCKHARLRWRSRYIPTHVGKSSHRII